MWISENVEVNKADYLFMHSRNIRIEDWETTWQLLFPILQQR